MIDRSHDLSIVRQAKVLNISRGSVYYQPRPVSAADLAIMRRIDELHLDYPFAGSRRTIASNRLEMLRTILAREGVAIGRRRVAAMMKRMGIEAIYRRPNTSKPTPGHKIYPYLLRGLKVERPNQVWAMDISRRLQSNRPDLHPDGSRLCVSGRRRRLVQPAGSVASRIDHDGGRLLRRGAGGGSGKIRQA
jgi:putative transposase